MTGALGATRWALTSTRRASGVGRAACDRDGVRPPSLVTDDRRCASGSAARFRRDRASKEPHLLTSARSRASEPAPSRAHARRALCATKHPTAGRMTIGHGDGVASIQPNRAGLWRHRRSPRATRVIEKLRSRPAGRRITRRVGSIGPHESDGRAGDLVNELVHREAVSRPQVE